MLLRILTRIQCFQPFSNRVAFETLLSEWHNLDTQNSPNFWIFKKHGKVRSGTSVFPEPRLIKAGLHN
jgi:hypothetical protein